jgi:bifunctional non-homologous end joining protein LigD
MPVADREVKFTHTERVMFPKAGITKGDLIEYYDRIADKLIPHLRDRPMTLERLPEGLARKDAPHFWQKNTPDFYPKWIPRIELRAEDGRKVKYLLVNDKPTLLYLVNQNCVTFHTWFSRVDELDRPDFVLFDIDPHQSTFGNAVKVAKELHDVLETRKVRGFVKTTGKTGLHVFTEWTGKGGYDAARDWAMTVAKEVVARVPRIATVERHISARGQRVYLDVEQNAKGKHAVPPYVVRATPLATASMPIQWKALNARLDPKKFTVKTASKWIRSADPFAPLAH